MKKSILFAIVFGIIISSSKVSAQGAPPNLTKDQVKEVAEAYMAKEGLKCDDKTPPKLAAATAPAKKKFVPGGAALKRSIRCTIDPEDSFKAKKPGKSVEVTVECKGNAFPRSFKAECDDCKIDEADDSEMVKRRYSKVVAIREIVNVGPVDKVKGGKAVLKVKVDTYDDQTKIMELAITWPPKKAEEATLSEAVLPPSTTPVPQAASTKSAHADGVVKHEHEYRESTFVETLRLDTDAYGFGVKQGMSAFGGGLRLLASGPVGRAKTWSVRGGIGIFNSPAPVFRKDGSIARDTDGTSPKRDLGFVFQGGVGHQVRDNVEMHLDVVGMPIGVSTSAGHSLLASYYVLGGELGARVKLGKESHWGIGAGAIVGTIMTGHESGRTVLGGTLTLGYRFGE